MNEQKKRLIMNAGIVLGLMISYDNGAPLPPILFSGAVAFAVVNGIIWWKQNRR